MGKRGNGAAAVLDREEAGEQATTLLETAEREADEAEAEFQAGARSQPGEQGIATQEEDTDEPPQVWDRSPSQREIVFADDELKRLRDHAHEMGAEAVIDALVRVVDVHPHFRMLHEWPGESNQTLFEAPLLAQIAGFLTRGCAKLEVSSGRVLFLWRNQRSWTKQGADVICDSVRLNDVASHVAGGKVAAVIGNFRLYQAINTRQKIARLYHALRQLSAEGSIQPHQFSGWLDEIELFGTGTFQMDALLRRAVEHGAQRELPFEEKVDVFTAATALDPDEGDED